LTSRTAAVPDGFGLVLVLVFGNDPNRFSGEDLDAVHWLPLFTEQKELKAPLFIAMLITLLSSCDRVKRTAKETINKTGETVGRSTTEFADGVSEGIDKTYQSTLAVSPELQQAGLSTGRFSVGSTDSSQHNVLTAYLIFDQDLDREILVKVTDRKGVEYGRVRQHIAGTKGEAKYYDFVFNKRTRFESKSSIRME
jgi:hypothetical protein